MTDPVQTSATPSFDADAALAQIEQTGEYSPSSPESTPTEQPAAAPAVQEFEYDWNGKKIKEPLEMVLKRAGMGYDYAQKMAAMKAKESEFAKTQERMKALQRWEEYDNFAKENPAWAQHVEQAWERRQQVLESQGAENPSNPLYGELQQVKQQLAQVSEFIGGVRRSEEDKALTTEIQSIRQKYGDLDFDLADESGKTLEYRILEHAQKNGIRSFKTAFHDFYHDNLIKMREDKAKEQVVKDQQARRKAGIIGVTTESKKGLQPANSVRGKSYDQLAIEALQELGLGH